MQIHEITKSRVDEGLLDLAKKAAGGVRGAVQGFQSNRQDRQTAQASAAVAKKATDAWTRYARNLKAITPDATRYQQLYQQALLAFVQKNLLGNQSIENAINKNEIAKLVTDITANEANPQQVAALFGQLVYQAALSQPDITRRNAPMLSKIISTNPAVIQFRNKTYVIGNQGEWIDQATNTVADQSFQAFLDQELAKAGVAI